MIRIWNSHIMTIVMQAVASNRRTPLQTAQRRAPQAAPPLVRPTLSRKRAMRLPRNPPSRPRILSKPCQRTQASSSPKTQRHNSHSRSRQRQRSSLRNL